MSDQIEVNEHAASKKIRVEDPPVDADKSLRMGYKVSKGGKA